MIDFQNIEIAGLDKVVLYENKGADLQPFSFQPSTEDILVKEVLTTGTVDEITNCIDIKFSRKISLGSNNKQLKNDQLQFNITNFNDETKELLRRLQRNRYGYLAKLHFLNEDVIILQDSLYFQKNSEKSFNRNNFQINLAYRVFSNKADLYKEPINDDVLTLTTTGGSIGIMINNPVETSVNWGDWTDEETFVNNVNKPHTYASEGDRNYEINIDNISSIEILDASSCNIEGGYQQIFNSIDNLQFLKLSGNSDLTGAIPSINQNIQTFWISGCSFNGVAPVGSTLLESYLCTNCNFTELPANIGDMTSITQLYFASNSLSGTIPNSIAQMINVSQCYFNNNQFTGVQLDAFILNIWTNLRIIWGANACDLRIQDNASGISADSVAMIEGTGLYLGDGLIDNGMSVTYTAA